MSAPMHRLETPFLARLLAGTVRWARRLFWTVLVVGTAVLVLEAIHLHQLLAGLHPWLAWAVTGMLLALVAGFIGWIAWRWWKLPRVIEPPELPPPADWAPRHRRRYLGFVRRWLARQEANPALEETARGKVPAVLERIEAIAAGEHDDEALVRVVEAEIDRLLEPLDRKARAEVWQAASQVALLTAVNPSALVDALVTLVRNLELMARVATLYYGRPGPLGTFRVVRDVLASAVTAGLVDRIADSAGSALAEVAGNWTARLAGPVGQGLVNGLLTVRLGDVAVLRCRSLRSRRVGIRPWTPTMWREAARRLAGLVGEELAPGTARAFRRASGVLGAGGRGMLRGLARLFLGLRDALASDEPGS